MKTQLMKLTTSSGHFTVIRDTKQQYNPFALYRTNWVWSDEKNRFVESTRLITRYADLASCIHLLDGLNLSI